MTAPITRTGRSGFTLIELLVVLTLIGILAGIAVPLYRDSVVRSREAVLKEDLYHLRDAIDKFRADQGAYPESLKELSGKRYIRSVPIDPFTGSADTWQEVPPEDGQGVWDVKSGSSAIGTNGMAYDEW